MKDETKSIFGIACLYTTITVLFALLGRLEAVFSADSLLEGLKHFIGSDMLWLMVAGITIYALYSLNARQKRGYAAMLNDSAIRKTTGVLLAITGLFNFASSCPALVETIASFRSFEAMSISTDSLIRASVTEAVGLMIDICQTIFGIYLLRFKNKSGGMRA
jgi:hypothetical protein